MEDISIKSVGTKSALVDPPMVVMITNTFFGIGYPQLARFSERIAPLQNVHVRSNNEDQIVKNRAFQHLRGFERLPLAV